MNFRTQVELPHKGIKISHSDQIVLCGSCFAENIGKLLENNKFRCYVNPFGILYNPLSIARALNEAISEKEYQDSDLFHASGMWHSWMHHSDFSSSSVEDCLLRINENLRLLIEKLPRMDWLIVTWGTAYGYFLQSTHEIVGNCHKQPDKLFYRRLLAVPEIVETWKWLLAELKARNPKLKVLFTVSPIRHTKDGMHGNQLSKSTLLLAVDELCNQCADCHYFPAYEIVMDELRDYRFYADDMVHLSDVAVKYIWECFGQCCFETETKEIIKEWEDVQKRLEHKPFNPESEAYQTFLSQIVLKIARIKEKFPYLEVQKEMELCESRLKK